MISLSDHQLRLVIAAAAALLIDAARAISSKRVAVVLQKLGRRYDERRR